MPTRMMTALQTALLGVIAALSLVLAIQSKEAANIYFLIASFAIGGLVGSALSRRG